jgi:hypothetical protein
MTLLIINIKSDIVGSLIWDFGCLLKEYICLKNISNWHLFIYILKIKKFKKYFQVKNTSIAIPNKLLIHKILKSSNLDFINKWVSKNCCKWNH